MKRSLVFVLLSTAFAGAHAQTYPTRPITLIAPASSSTTPDIVARLLAEKLAESLKQPVVVENRTGASGTLGISAVARAAPDGYTLLVVSNTMGMVSWLYKGLVAWDPVDSFVPLARFANSISSLVVNNDLPAHSVKELVALAQKEPGKINFATPGVGSPHHLATELFKQKAKVDIFHVPYKTTASALTDIGSNQVQMGIFPLSGVAPLVTAGRMRILATLGDTRIKSMPDVPTIRESGYDITYSGWVGAFAPKGTPPEIVARLSEEMRKIAESPDFQKKLSNAGLAPDPGGQQDMAKLLSSDLAKWKTVITNGISK
jgi:tripartite-type tricarboxylate transporter receptor subunit TctC